MILVVLHATPTAINSFVMAKEMNGNEKLAANIVVFTTSVSVAVIYAGMLLIETMYAF